MEKRQVFISSDSKGTTRLFEATLNQVRTILSKYVAYEMKPTKVEGKDAIYVEAANNQDSIIAVIEVLEDEIPKSILSILKLGQGVRATAMSNPHGAPNGAKRATKSLSAGNPTKAARDFIAKKIKKLLKEGYPQKQAVAIAYQYARDAGYKVPSK